MVTVKFFGLLRLDLKIASVEVEANDIKELFAALENKISGVSAKELKGNKVFVNGKDIVLLKKFRTKLKAGDVVLIMSPVSGG